MFTPNEILSRWGRYRNAVLLSGIVLMLAAGAARWPYELGRALVRTDHSGHDLRLRYDEVQDWFAGESFQVESSGTYPPASYPLLWPAIGWMDFRTARWLWTATTLALLAWLAALAVRESTATGRLEKTFLVMFFFTAYAPLVTIGNGQMTIHVIAALMASFELWKRRPFWLGSVGSAVMMLAALVKPSLAAPFFWVTAFAAPSRWTAALVVAGYAMLTWFAGLFQPDGLIALFERWIETSAHQMLRLSYSDIPAWMDAAGIHGWSMPVSLGVLGLLGVWVWRYRRADHWLLLGVTAIVSRVWTTHRLYDDLLIFIPMIVLWKIAKESVDVPSHGLVAAGLFAGNWFAQMAPVSLVATGGPLGTAFVVGQTVLWLGTVVFLSRMVQRWDVDEGSPVDLLTAQSPARADN